MPEILRCRADDGTITDHVSRSQRDAIREYGMRLNDAVISQGHSLLNKDIRADHHILAKNGFGAD